MAIRTVRLDVETERALEHVREATGLGISDALKQGVHALRARMQHDAPRRPYDVYRQLELGPGGNAIARSTDVRRGVTKALRRKLKR